VSSAWWMYVEQTAAGDSQARIAARIGLTGPSVGRWAKGALPDPSTAAEFARQYGRPVLEAFLAAGFLTPEEAGETPAQRHSIGTISNEELLAEIRARFTKAGEPHA
jgi:transcriptional regulator with XRE-family HTH domain